MNINKELKEYLENSIFPIYEKNEPVHNIEHIKYVINRSIKFAETIPNINYNIVYTVAVYHDIGHHINPKTHELISAEMMYNDNNLKNFFTDEERTIIKEAIEDHRSSKKDNPRTKYVELISSADRNTRIEIVFIRRFFVAHERMPDMNIEEYRDFTYKRLSKRYGEEVPENMF